MLVRFGMHGPITPLLCMFLWYGT